MVISVEDIWSRQMSASGYHAPEMTRPLFLFILFVPFPHDRVECISTGPWPARAGLTHDEMSIEGAAPVSRDCSGQQG